jgi:hypothetical protein
MTHPSTLLKTRTRPSLPLGWTLSLGLTALLGGCIESRSLKPEFTFKVSPGNTSGSYTVSGQTNLPDPKPNKQRQSEATTIIVQAIRTLRPSPQAKQLSNNQPIQVVVARQQATVSKGSWQTTLNLYSPTNQALESWQVNQNLSLKGFEPDQQLTFVATTLPLDPSLKLATPQPEAMPEPDSPLKINESGRYYLKAEQASSIAPPAPNPKSTTGDRSLIKLKSSPAKGENPPRLNGANLKPQEYMR